MIRKDMPGMKHRVQAHTCSIQLEEGTGKSILASADWQMENQEDCHSPTVCLGMVKQTLPAGMEHVFPSMISVI